MALEGGVREEEKAAKHGREERAGTGQVAWSLTLRSLQTAFADAQLGACPNPDLNARIAASILACFEPELFESVGHFRSLWTDRLLATTNDVGGLMDELLGAAS